MAGISDAPFRQICQEMGAALTTSEMLTSDTRLWHSRKSSQRLEAWPTKGSTQNPLLPRSIQIAGSDPVAMAKAANAAVQQGAQLVDINMGCPAKKVCNKAAGSALLRDEALVDSILKSVTQAVSVPVTLKIRTGWCPDTKNAQVIAQLAEQNGIQALVIHGRTRACRFQGEAEYQTIADVVQSVSIPVIANGDIDSPAKAKTVLTQTGAAGVMIGRAAQGNPWLIREIDQFLKNGERITAPSIDEIEATVIRHLISLHQFYGEHMGVKIARKHIKWYLQTIAERLNTETQPITVKKYLTPINEMETPGLQIEAVASAIERLTTQEDLAA